MDGRIINHKEHEGHEGSGSFRCENVPFCSKMFHRAGLAASFAVREARRKKSETLQTAAVGCIGSSRDGKRVWQWLAQAGSRRELVIR